MRKASGTDDESADSSTILFHSLHDSTSFIELGSDDVEEAYEKMRAKLKCSREAFKQASAAASVDKPSVRSHLLLVTLEIKPYDTNEELQALGEAITSTAWHSVSYGESSLLRRIQLKWQPWKDAYGVSEDTIGVVTIGYCISKLLLQ